MTKTSQANELSFKCKLYDLASALKSVSGAFAARTRLPVLLNVLLEPSGNGMRVTATNLDLWTRTEFLAEVQSQDRVALDFGRLSDFVAGFNGGDVAVSVESGKTTIKSGRSRLTLTTIGTTEFPTWPERGESAEFIIPAKTLGAMLKYVARSMSDYKARYVLNGALWRSRDNSLEVVAVDGRRLAQAKATCSGPSDEFKAIIPAKTVKEVGTILSASEDGVNATVSLNSGGILFRAGGLEIFSKLVEGEFPDYEKVIPEKSEHIIVADTEEVIAALKRVALCSDAMTRTVKIKVKADGDPSIILHSASQLAEGEEVVPCSYEGDGVELAMDHKYLMDALQSIGEGKFRMGINAAMSPVLLEHESMEGHRHVVMPLRA